MAIKIKKKDNRDESPEEADAQAAAQAATADAFERASLETAAWIEENRGLVLGLLIAVAGLAIAGYFGLQYLETQQVQASAQLSPAFDAYAKPVKGSAEYEAFQKSWEGEMPETFEDDTAKWQTIYDSADETLSGGDAVVLPAKLAKAGAALKLGKVDEALGLYEEVVDATSDQGILSAAYLGLATARTEKENWDGAIEAYEKLGELDEDLSGTVRYRKARLLEKKGDVEAAKELYHTILDEDPQTPNKTDIERRLATL